MSRSTLAHLCTAGLVLATCAPSALRAQDDQGRILVLLSNKNTEADWKVRVVPEAGKGAMTLDLRETEEPQPVAMDGGDWASLDKDTDYFLAWIPPRNAAGKLQPSSRTFQLADGENKNVANFVVKYPPSLSWKKEPKDPGWYENFDITFQVKDKEDTAPMAVAITSDTFVTD